MTKNRPVSHLWKFCRATAGATAVEMAFVVLLFIFIFYAIFQFSWGMYMWNSLMLAAEEGGRAAMIHNSDYTTNGCAHLWNTYVEPVVAYNLPGGSTSGYTVKYQCQPSASQTSPATMAIGITYSLVGGGSFGAGMSIPGLTLSGAEQVPLD